MQAGCREADCMTTQKSSLFCWSIKVFPANTYAQFYCMMIAPISPNSLLHESFQWAMLVDLNRHELGSYAQSLDQNRLHRNSGDDLCLDQSPFEAL